MKISDSEAITNLRIINAYLTQLLQKALPYIEDVEDCGPVHNGWQSTELGELIGEIKDATK